MTQLNTSSQAMVDLTRVSKTYPPDVRALDDITLSISKGELVYLIGRSGSGKTTLLKLISRIDRPTKGMIEVAGMDITKIQDNRLHLLRRKIGMAYQDFKLLPDRTVAANVAISMEVAHRKNSFIHKQTKELLDRLGLSRKTHTLAAELSRGEQQRVAIARAVANQPEIILADEPTGNLDSDTTSRVMDLFHELHKKGTTLLIATHDENIYKNSSNRIIELRFGRQQATDLPAPIDTQSIIL
ncbi:cell division ATP-binding protein FtsE [Desulfogranum japonicum]|uniref:cell division ATP-binding protein FtsE n=1 Tax=Desulfogranum japonicum TaxID=231447 RepID=UPI000415CD87|nr:cell division ATP-binding protein FtsE [Desulfogranum japonicum]